MKYRLLVFDEVYTDIEDARKWYKSQRTNLDNDFAEAIEEALDIILKMPAAFEVRYKNIRIAHPKRFPYNIHFYTDEAKNTVVVTAIVHGRRRISEAKKRLIT